MLYGRVIEDHWKWVASLRKLARIDIRFQCREVLGEAVMKVRRQGIQISSTEEAAIILWSRPWVKWVFHPRLEVGVRRHGAIDCTSFTLRMEILSQEHLISTLEGKKSELKSV